MHALKVLEKQADLQAEEKARTTKALRHKEAE